MYVLKIVINHIIGTYGLSFLIKNMEMSAKEWYHSINDTLLILVSFALAVNMAQFKINFAYYIESP